MLALIVMGLGTLGMGLTPAYTVIGSYGLVLLSVFRLVQGFLLRWRVRGSSHVASGGGREDGKEGFLGERGWARPCPWAS